MSANLLKVRDLVERRFRAGVLSESASGGMQRHDQD
jgi:hypothetical protein